jgi:hypothetical protein
LQRSSLAIVALILRDDNAGGDFYKLECEHLNKSKSTQYLYSGYIRGARPRLVIFAELEIIAADEAANPKVLQFKQIDGLVLYCTAMKAMLRFFQDERELTPVQSCTFQKLSTLDIIGTLWRVSLLEQQGRPEERVQIFEEKKQDKDKDQDKAKDIERQISTITMTCFFSRI